MKKKKFEKEVPIFHDNIWQHGFNGIYVVKHDAICLERRLTYASKYKVLKHELGHRVMHKRFPITAKLFQIPQELERPISYIQLWIITFLVVHITQNILFIWIPSIMHLLEYLNERIIANRLWRLEYNAHDVLFMLNESLEKKKTKRKKKHGQHKSGS